MSTSAYRFLSDFINQGRYDEIASMAHDAWRAEKEKQGWTYGRHKSNEKQTHPFMKPFNELTKWQQIGNNLSAYSTVNFFRTRFKKLSVNGLIMVFDDLMAGKREALMEELGEYVHSHFTASLIAQKQTLAERPDMVVYEALDEDVQELDLVIARATIRFLKDVMEKDGELETE